MEARGSGWFYLKRLGCDAGMWINLCSVVAVSDVQENAYGTLRFIVRTTAGSYEVFSHISGSEKTRSRGELVSLHDDLMGRLIPGYIKDE